MPEQQMYYPLWMRGNEALMRTYREEWEATGDTVLALEAVRASEAYDEAFVGNKRDDGSVRYDENTYLSVRESYENVLLSVNVNPDLFQNQFGNLIAGNVAPAEFATRVEAIYTRVIDSAPQIMEYYETNFGTEINESGIMASLLDPDIGQAVINKQISMAEVGGNASMRGFTVTTDFANQLVNAGLDSSSEAAQFFGLAEGILPTLQMLTQRHMDPDDDFSLEDFASAQIFSDAEQRRRIRQMSRTEAASFGRGAGGGLMQPGEMGPISGLVDR